MAQTKVSLIQDNVIVVGHLHTNHGITTGHIGEGSNLYFTDARVMTSLGSISTHIIPDTDITYDLGSATNRFRDLYLSGNTIHLGGDTKISVNNDGEVEFKDSSDAPKRLKVRELDFVDDQGRNKRFKIDATSGKLATFDATGTLTADKLDLSAMSTTDLAEGSNLYYTDARVGTYLTTNNYATQGYVQSQVSGLVASAPSTLDTLNELAAALGDDPNFATTVSSQIGGKLSSSDSRISNWDAAYGWGNHASVGYLTSVSWGSVTDKPSTFTPSSHNHDDRYYTETESDARFQPIGSYAAASHSHSYLPLSGGTLDNGTSTNLFIKCDDGGQAFVRANGDGQGTGIFEVGQSDSYGGGFYYNGDGSPTFVSGEKADYITFYRMSGGTRYIVFEYPYSSNTVDFKGTPTVNGSDVITSSTIGSQSVNYASSAGNADTVDGYHASSLWRSDGATWNPSANVTLNQSANNQEWSFDIIRNGHSGGYWQVWDSSNSTMLKVDAVNGKVYAPYNFVGNLEGNASSASSVAWSNVSSKPADWLNNAVLIQSKNPSDTAFPSGFYQWSTGSQTPTGTWFNYINVRHSNVGNGHGYQLGMSYYDNNLWFRSYQGGTSPTFQSWETAIGSGGSNQTKSGYLQSNSSLRAPVFYDSNNTNWWIDPAADSSAKFARFVQIGDSSSYNSNSGSWGARLNVTDNVHARIDVAQDANGMHSYWYAHTGQSSIKFGTTSAHGVEFVSNNSGRGQITSGGTLEWWNNVSAPRFYDYNNTSYYIDANGDSVVGQIRFDNATNGWTGMFGSYDLSRTHADNARHGLVINAGYYPHIDVNATATTDTNPTHGAVISMTGKLGSGYRRWGMGIAQYNPNELSFGYYDNQANPHYGVGINWSYPAKMWIDTGGHLYSTGSMRSPIFYDSNNTGYYVDPSGTSNFNEINAEGRRINTDNFRSRYRRGFHVGGTADKFYKVKISIDQVDRLRIYRYYAWTIGGSSSYWNGGSSTHFGALNFVVDTLRNDWGGHRSMMSGYLQHNYTTVMGRARIGQGSEHGYAIVYLRGGAGGSGAYYRLETESIHVSEPVIDYNDYITTADDDFNYNYANREINIHGTHPFIHYAENSHRSPIFYDSNDTNYYCNPNSTSRLNIVYADGGDYYGGTYFYSNKGATSGSLSSPALQVYATGGNSAFMSFHRSGNYAVNMGLDSDNVLRIGGWSASANRWQLDMSGNNWVAGSSRAPIFYDSNNTGYYVDPASTSNINALTTAGTITAPFVDINKTSTYGPGMDLTFSGSQSTGMLIRNNTGSTTQAISFFYSSAPQGARGSITVSSTSTAYNTSSDYRLKENLIEITDGIERVKLLQPKRFNFIGDDKTVDGFVAHEAQEVVPEAVTGVKDGVDHEGNPEYQGIDQAKLVPLLTAALQEAIAKIEDLESRLQAIENQ